MRRTVRCLGWGALMAAAAAILGSTAYGEVIDDCPGCRKTAILAINDVYRFAGVDDGRTGGLARLRKLRRELETKYPDLLVLHAGDLLFPSLISRTCKGELMVRALNLLDGEADVEDERMLVVFGNHEFDDDHCEVLERRLMESEFSWLDTNVSLASCTRAPALRGEKLFKHRLIESGGIRVGVFGLTIPSKKQEYIEGYLDNLREVARRETAELRAEGAQVVVALTHLNRDDDCDLFKHLGGNGPNLIVGGHDHDRSVGCDGDGRPIFKADSDLRSASVIVLSLDAQGHVDVQQEFRSLEDASPAPDSMLQAVADEMVGWHERLFCAHAAHVTGVAGDTCTARYESLEAVRSAGDPPGYDPECLETELGKTATELVGEETAIRRGETSLGNWVADRMRESYEPCGAQIAFVNSGSLRLNQDLPAGSTIRRRHLEELVQYDGPLHLIELDGATLQKVVDRSIEEWPGSGHFLQVSGFAFQHDLAAKTATALTLRADGRGRPIHPGDRIRAVVPDYLVDPKGDQDGYTMLSMDQKVADCQQEVSSLYDVLQADLARHSQAGIDPVLEGRICQRPGEERCLANVSEARSPQPSPCQIVALIVAGLVVLLPLGRLFITS